MWQFQKVFKNILQSRTCVTEAARILKLSTTSSVLQSGPKIAKIDTNGDKKLVTVTWENGKTGVFPFVWLRDNSHDSETFHLTEQLKARNIHYDKFKFDIVPADLSINFDSYGIEIRWPCGLQSSYSSNWLLERNFADEIHKKKRREIHFQIGQGKVLWNREKFEKEHPQILWSDLKKCGQAYHDWLTGVWRYGAGLIRQTGAEFGIMNQFIDNYMGHTWNSYYGITWDLTPQEKPANLGFVSGKGLNLHTDLACYEEPPGLLCFHMVKPAKIGGESHLVDSFQIGELLKKHHPDVFKILTETLIENIDEGETDIYPFSMLGRHPILELNSRGEFVSACFSNHMRSWFFDQPPDKIEEIYRAIRIFMEYSYNRDNLWEFRLEAGDMLLFDNKRCMHSRTAYECEPGEYRLVEGAYFGWDVVKSRIRLLKNKLDTRDNTPAF